MTSSSKDDSVVDLLGQGFMFALKEIDPRIGVLGVYYTERSHIKEVIKTPIELV